MQKITFLFFLTIFMATNSVGQILTSNDLTDKLITAFQTQNFESYKALMLDAVDYRELSGNFFKNNRIPESEKKHFAKNEKMFADSSNLQYRKVFERLLNKGLKLGIDWTQIIKSDFIFKDDKPINSDIQTLGGHLNFTYKETTFVIFGIEAVKLSSGYKISNIRTILKGGVAQYVDADLLDDEDM